MKNRFGFIPIVLPVLVMVLIIGLINLTGVAQTPVVEAQEAPRLSDLELTYDVGNATGGTVDLSPSFTPGRMSYEAYVDHDTTDVTVTISFGANMVAEIGNTTVNTSPVGYTTFNYNSLIPI